MMCKQEKKRTALTSKSIKLDNLVRSRCKRIDGVSSRPETVQVATLLFQTHQTAFKVKLSP